MGNRILDLTGEKYGKLTVLEQGPRSKDNRISWICLCECGKTTTVTSNSLRKKNKDRTASCGCANPFFRYGQEKIFPDLEYGNQYKLLVDYVQSARRRDFEWLLSPDEAIALFIGNCHYCGGEPAGVRKDKPGKEMTYNGIDRVDPTVGYIVENCVSCCSRCNYLKGGMHLAEFLAAIEEIYLHGIKKLG